MNPKTYKFTKNFCMERAITLIFDLVTYTYVGLQVCTPKKIIQIPILINSNPQKSFIELSNRLWILPKVVEKVRHNMIAIE